MDENLRQIEELCKERSDELFIVHDELMCLRGFQIDDSPLDGDYYYILQKMNGKFEHHSCVGRIIPLKGKIEKHEYDGLRTMFQANLDRLSREVK